MMCNRKKTVNEIKCPVLKYLLGSSYKQFWIKIIYFRNTSNLGVYS